MNPLGSLRLRLLSGAVLWVTLAILLAGLAIAFLFRENAERAARQELENRLNRLVAATDARSPKLVLVSEPIVDPRYETPFSGAYWQVRKLEEGPIVRSRSLWDSVLELPADMSGAKQFETIAGPDGQQLLTASVVATFGAEPHQEKALVTVAEDSSLLDSAQQRFVRDLSIALGMLGVALVGAAWLQVTIGLRPLHHLRAGIGAVRRSSMAHLPGDFPVEVKPLVDEIEELLASHAETVQFARARASDLAHGLKTPLAVLSGLADSLRRKGDVEDAETIEEITDQINQRVEYQLRLSRLFTRVKKHALRADLNTSIRRSVAVLKKTAQGEKLEWDFQSQDDLMIDMDPQDLMELVGVLLENACKWAKHQVTITTAREGQSVLVRIIDDGPGLEWSKLGRLGQRGQTLDSPESGTGLGIAIAQEIVAMNKGQMHFKDAPKGGLCVQINLLLTEKIAPTSADPL
ncbi:MAG: HAMP domain-containing sensor histidine kinase [Mesorhizobium sp.]